MWGTGGSVREQHPKSFPATAGTSVVPFPPPAPRLHPPPRSARTQRAGMCLAGPGKPVKTTQTTLQNQRPGPHFAQIKFYCCWNHAVCLARPNPDGIFLQPCKRNQAAGEAAQPRGFGSRRKVGLAWEPS